MTNKKNIIKEIDSSTYQSYKLENCSQNLTKISTEKTFSGQNNKECYEFSDLSEDSKESQTDSESESEFYNFLDEKLEDALKSQQEKLPDSPDFIFDLKCIALFSTKMEYIDDFFRENSITNTTELPKNCYIGFIMTKYEYESLDNYMEKKFDDSYNPDYDHTDQFEKNMTDMYNKVSESKAFFLIMSKKKVPISLICLK